ncbi:sensor histidine kinase [Xanthomonas citri pv. glycines]|nr:sensor histidine kinase [Xanthomonas citri pv. glycines]
MRKQGKRSPRTRWIQVRLSRERGRRRAARRAKLYNPPPIELAHSPKLNPNYRMGGGRKFKGSSFIEIPLRLECHTPDDWDILLALLRHIRRAALVDHLRRVVLNFHDVQFIAPEAAVTIVAEIQRCKEFCDKRTTITGTYPSSHNVASLLCDVGFFKALQIKPPALPKAFLRRTYLQIERHNQTIAEVADQLLDCFSEVFDFEGGDRKRLHVALVESMDNVFEHAYLPHSTRPDLIREWWLAGYADKDEGTISFTFYDQGAGIPSTIRARQGDRIRSYLSNWTDGRWIERALSKGVSRHGSKRRGHGLLKLREFIDRIDVEGSLRVIANRGFVTFNSDGRSAVSNTTKDLHGTLVSWQLRGITVQVPGATPGEVGHAT